MAAETERPRGGWHRSEAGRKNVDSGSLHTTGRPAAEVHSGDFRGRKFGSWRLGELKRLAAYWRGQGVVLADVDGWTFALADALACGRPGRIKIEGSRRTVPWRGLDVLTLAEAVRDCGMVPADPDHLRTIITAVERAHRKASGHCMTADRVATLLGVTDQDRAAIELRTIGAVDIGAAQRRDRTREEKRRRDRERARTKRATTHKPRGVSAKATRPWEAAGFRCRRTWERHGKPSETPRVANVSPHHVEKKDRATNLRQPSLTPWKAAGCSRATWFRRKKKAEGSGVGSFPQGARAPEDNDKPIRLVRPSMPASTRTISLITSRLPIGVRIPLPERRPSEPPPEPGCWVTPCKGGWRWITRGEIAERWPYAVRTAA